MTTERSPLAYRVTAVMVAAALAGGLAACDRQKNSPDAPTSVNPARGDTGGPGGSTGPVGVPPATGATQADAPASAASSPRELR